ncbi:MAG: pyridoxal-phosphate dependent enzyme [Deinococcota bacterium]
MTQSSARLSTQQSSAKSSTMQRSPWSADAQQACLHQYHQAIQAAHQHIDSVFLNTPQVSFDALNEVVGANVLLKVETLNPIRSFKGRGTSYFVHEHVHEAKLVCASAGNFGQGLAYAGQQQGSQVTVFAATTANPLKLERMRQLGAQVELVGDDFDAAKDAAKAYAREYDYRYVEDGKEAEVTAGAGTLGLELSRHADPLDVVLVPLGNGALLNGIGLWFKANDVPTKIIAVVAAGAPAMDDSWRAGEVINADTVSTIADGIAVRKPVPEALELMQLSTDDVLQVSDEDILNAMKLAQLHAGLVLEPAGAAGLAALLAYPNKFAGQHIATPLCGSNVTEAQLQAWF